MMTVGVLAFQGDVSEHFEMLKCAGAKALAVRHPHELEAVDALIIPGGESTTVGLLLKQTTMDVAIQKRAREGMPIWGTCMGAILMAKRLIGNRVNQSTLGLMDISVRRNAFGRQRESFEGEIEIPKVSGTIQCAFIRAPRIEEVGPGVEVLAAFQGKPVLVRERKFMASAFHSEIAGDARLHHYFVGLIGKQGLTN